MGLMIFLQRYEVSCFSCDSVIDVVFMGEIASIHLYTLDLLLDNGTERDNLLLIPSFTGSSFTKLCPSILGGARRASVAIGIRMPHSLQLIIGFL